MALIRALNEKKIPSFGEGPEDARSGMLAAMVPEDIRDKVIRRVCLNMEAFLDGTPLAKLPVHIPLEERLTINMKTAALIGTSPPFSVMTQAALLHENYIHTTQGIGLVEAMTLALESNLDIALSRLELDGGRRDLDRAWSAWKPRFGATFSGVTLDGETARKSGGIRSENTTTASISASQLLFDTQALNRVRSGRHQVTSGELSLEKTRRDVLFSTIQAYFGVLKAKTARKIRRDNLDLMAENLKISQRREAAGYSGRSDLLRWKSELAQARTLFLSARQDVRLARSGLNRILNIPQGDLYHIQDVSLDDDVFSIYRSKAVESYIKDQEALNRFTRFFIDQCIGNSVAIQALDEKRRAQVHTLTALEQKRFLPQLRFAGNHSRVLSRSGDGSDVPGVDPVDDPWDMGIYGELPFYSGGAVSAEIARARVDIRRLETQRAQLALNVEKSARESLANLIVSVVALENSREAARYAGENLELVQDAYAKGTVTVVELADAQNNALTSDLNFLDSTYDYLVRLFSVERVYGYYSLLLPGGSPDRLGERFKRYIEEGK